MDLIGVQVGNYVVKKVLGAGGMGTVYLCEHPLIGRKCALKVLHEEHSADPDTVERFFREARAANEIGHENIVDILDFGSINGPQGAPQAYMIMELLDGVSLGGRMGEHRLTIEEIRHILVQCCSALSASHAKGIVHRDLKPENIYLVKRGGDVNFVKILDFGIAKLLGGQAGSGRTRIGVVLGTPGYMSPEQCEGRGLIDRRSDVYSLGVVLYEMLTGRVPFTGDSYSEVIVAHLTQMPEPPTVLDPGIPHEWEAIALHALEKDPDRRFQSMDEVAAAVADPMAHLQWYRNMPPPAQRTAVHSGRTVVMDRGAATAAPPQPAPPVPPVPLPPPLPSAPTISAVAGSPPPNRPTTLTGAAAELQPIPAPVRDRRGRWPALVIGAVLATGGVVAGLVFGSRGGGERGDRPSPVAAAPPRAEAPSRPDAAPVTAAVPAPVPAPTPAPAPVPAPAAADAGPAPAPPAPTSVQVVVVSDPPGAQVTRLATHEPLGRTPIHIVLPKGEPAFEIELAFEGRPPVRQSIDGSGSREVKIVFAAAAERPAKKPVKKPVVKKRPPKDKDGLLKPIELE